MFSYRRKKLLSPIRSGTIKKSCPDLICHVDQIDVLILSLFFPKLDQQAYEVEADLPKAFLLLLKLQSYQFLADLFELNQMVSLTIGIVGAQEHPLPLQSYQD